jgi:putative ABC transport system permease protein
LVLPASRLDYEYRIKIDGDALVWGESFSRAFPDTEFEVRSLIQREGRIAEVLGQIGSGLMLIGFSALFIGGLGVFNSVRAYLDSKLATIATLRALGMRERGIAATYLLQVLILAASSALVGVIIGGALAVLGAQAAAEQLPVATDALNMWPPLTTAWVFGVLTAVTFALPAIGRALSVAPAALFRGTSGAFTATPRRWWYGTVAGGVLMALLAGAALPQPLFGLAFAVVTAALLVLLEAVVRMVRAGAHRLGSAVAFGRHFSLKLAVANLCRPGAPLRVTLLSLGAALTVLVASTVVVGALLETIERTIPERAPALIFYDVTGSQTGTLRTIVAEAKSFREVHLAPLVLGRMSHVNGEALRDSTIRARALESRDEHKLTHRSSNIDGVTIQRGKWWPVNYAGPPLVAFEDREADQLGLQVGDRLRFQILGQSVEAELAAIYSQRGIGTRFWFEGVFSDDVLDTFVTRYVGTAYLDHAEAIEFEAQVARAMPNVIVVRTERILREARAMLDRASLGLGLIAAITLLSSWLVLVSVIAASQTRQVYDATVLHVLGARIAQVRASLTYEYLLIAALTSLFSIAAGCAIAAALLHWRIQVGDHDAWWLGILVAVVVSATSMGLGAHSLLRVLRIVPARLLRTV